MSDENSTDDDWAAALAEQAAATGGAAAQPDDIDDLINQAQPAPMQSLKPEPAAGEPLDVLVNGTLIAHGEVVVVNEKFGIRLTDVVSAHERVRKLA